MGSSKKHKRNKSERRERYEEYSNSMDPVHLQRGLKLILKVGSNSTPEYGSGDSPANTMAMINYTSPSGPPTAVEAMMSAAPSSDLPDDDDAFDASAEGEYRGERHKKSKKKKKKKDREKKHKHHKEKRHRSERHGSGGHHRDDADDLTSEQDQLGKSSTPTGFSHSPKSAVQHQINADGESSQDEFTFIDENSQPLPENILYYAGMTTENSPSCRPVSKPIVPLKPDDLLLVSPVSASLRASISPTKLLPDLMLPSLSPSTAASTPGGTSGINILTPKPLEAPKTPSSSSDSGREPRTCVLKLKQQKSPLNKLLDHLLRFLEKRDPHQFFAWPVTDDIAPGYSSIIAKPMDFSTMRQKIDDSEYSTLTEFTDDFKLMCENAIRYNHVDTVYNKAAKRLLQVGMKHLMSENLMRSLKPLSGYMRELTAKELGFEFMQGDFPYDAHNMPDSADEGASTGADEPASVLPEEDEKRRLMRAVNAPKTRYEPYVDDMMPEEILEQVNGSARDAKRRLMSKDRAHKMGFLRQSKDGTTTLNILIKNDNEGPEKVVTIGELVGKLKDGATHLQAMREDKRNDVKLPKSLNYGAFATFAPAFDSRFSNLGKEETQLVLRTYGDAAAAEYAESIQQFAQHSSYAAALVDGLLDILTNNEHSKATAELYNMQCQNYEQTEVQKCFNKETVDDTREHIEEEYEKYKNTIIDFNRLRSLSDIGIDIGFLDNIEADMKNFELTRRLQEHLSNNLNLIEKLRATQNDRLSQPVPANPTNTLQPGPEEVHLAHQITQQLSDLAKKLPPSAIADPYSVRKAMGMSYVGLPPPPPPPPSVDNQQQTAVMPPLLQSPVAMPQLNLSQPQPQQQSQPQPQPQSQPQLNSSNLMNVANDSVNSNSSMPMDIMDDVVTTSGVDLENELREFLESGPGLAATSTADDNNIVAQLLMH